MLGKRGRSQIRWSERDVGSIERDVVSIERDVGSTDQVFDILKGEGIVRKTFERFDTNNNTSNISNLFLRTLF